MRMRRLPPWGPLAGGLVAMLACAPPARVRYEERARAAPAPARHAVHSERLAQLMRGLDEQGVARMPQAMDMELERERRLDDLIEVLRTMAASAARIPETVAELDLEEAERGELLRLASELQQQAVRFADEAPRLSPEALRARAQRIESTCAECHQRFRIPRVPDD